MKALMVRRATRLAVAVLLAREVPAHAQSRVSGTVQKTGLAEKVATGSPTPGQSAELEGRIAALKTRTSALAGTLSVRRPAGVARLKALAALLAVEESDAKAAHGAPRKTNGARVVAAFNARNFEGILTVNGKARGWRVTPGGFVTIDGQGLGDTVGEVRIFGQFPGGPQPLTPLEWHSDRVYAQLPLGLGGVLDHDIQIGVVTSARKAFRLEGGTFIATRGPEFVVTSQVHRLIRYEPGGWSATMDDVGRVYRWWSGHGIDCLPPSFDRLTAVDPGRGFTVTGLSARLGRTDSGDGDANGAAGSRTFFPGYSFGDWVGDDMRLRWGVWRSHTSPSVGGLVDGLDVCRSDYQIEVSVQGPLGVPF